MKLSFLQSQYLQNIIRFSKIKPAKIKLLPYALLGIGVFSFAPSSELHPYLQIYITLFELKLGILLIYLATTKLAKLEQRD